MTQHVRNILKIYRRATTDDVINGVEWYDRAKRYADTISEKTGVHLHTVIGVEIGRRIILLFSLGRKRSQRLVIFKYSKTFVRDSRNSRRQEEY